MKVASLSTNLTSTSLHGSFTFMLTSARLSGLARRFDDSTLLTVMVGVRFSPSAVVARCFLLCLLHLRHSLFREYHQ